MMQFTFVLADFTPGGAQRVASIILNGLAERGASINVVCLSAPVTSFFPLHPSITVHFLDILHPTSGITDAVKSNVNRVRRLRDALKRMPGQTIISFVVETNILTLLATVGLGRHVIVSERADPRYFPQNRYWRVLRDIAYPLASVLVCQTRFAAAYFCHRNGLIIPNPVVLQNNPPVVPPVSAGKVYAIAVGRLDPVKNYAGLLSSYAPLAAKYPALDLVIVGEGAEQARIEADIQAKNLQGRVHMTGALPDPQGLIAAAEMFVMPSISEGMPNALLEAMMLGVPSISTLCSPSIAEILQDEEQGLLVPLQDDAAFSHAMERLHTDKSLRDKLSAGARRDSAVFAADTVLDAWARIIR